MGQSLRRHSRRVAWALAALVIVIAAVSSYEWRVAMYVCQNCARTECRERRTLYVPFTDFAMCSWDVATRRRADGLLTKMWDPAGTCGHAWRGNGSGVHRFPSSSRGIGLDYAALPLEGWPEFDDFVNALAKQDPAFLRNAREHLHARNLREWLGEEFDRHMEEVGQREAGTDP